MFDNLDKKLLIFEFGVGFNTPGIIRFPFENLVYNYDNFNLIRFNDKYYKVPSEIKDRSISVKDDNNKVIKELI